MNDAGVLTLASTLSIDWSRNPTAIRDIFVANGHNFLSKNRIKKMKADHFQGIQDTTKRGGRGYRVSNQDITQYQYHDLKPKVDNDEDMPEEEVTAPVKRDHGEENHDVMSEQQPLEVKRAKVVNGESTSSSSTSAVSGLASSFASRTTETTREFLTANRFDDLSIGEASKKALRDVMGYEYMTKVQSDTIGPLLAGNDVLAKAKTGTGKTLGFLIPTVEKVLKSEPRCQQKTPRYTSVRPTSSFLSLVVSPTRELAQQIAEEAHALTTYVNNPTFNVVTVYGGTNMKKDVQNLGIARNRCVDLLVATPGRLLDHFENTQGFALAVGGSLQVLIFDEADRLLDMGFRKEIEKILSFLPKEGRQTLLFSATIPPTIKEVAHICLKPTYKTVDCVGETEKQVVDQVGQELIIIPSFKDELATLFDLIITAIQGRPHDYKLIIFFITARQTGFVSEVAREFFKKNKINTTNSNNFQNKVNNVNLYEIHSRKSQSYRNKSSDSFRTCRTGIMFSSDVSARGLDYPGVTHVIQVGAPANREQYIHRLGRTARAGESGRGLLLMHSFEKYFLRDIKDLELHERQPSSSGGGDWQSLLAEVRSAVHDTQVLTREQCYQAWLGYYNGLQRKLGWTKEYLVEQVNCYSKDVLELKVQPKLLRKTIGKMGLQGVRGLLW